MAGVGAYDSGLEHLLDELNLIDRSVRDCVQKSRLPGPGGMSDLLGLYISEEEVDGLLAEPLISLKSRGKYSGAMLSRGEIDARVEASLSAGRELRLIRLSSIFGLDRMGLDILLVCLAPEIDLRFERLYAYLQDDVTKKRPTISLISKILCSDTEGALSLLRRFYSGRRPLKGGLVYYADGDVMSDTPLLSRPLKVDDRIVAYLLGSDDIDERIRDHAYLVSPGDEMGEPATDVETRNMVNAIDGFPEKECSIFYLHGPDIPAKKQAARTVCNALGSRMLVAGPGSLKGEHAREMLRKALNEALLQGAIPYFEDFDAVVAGDSSWAMRDILESGSGAILSGEYAIERPGWMKNNSVINIGVKLPSAASRKKIWDRSLSSIRTEGVNTGRLATMFRMGEEMICQAIVDAVREASSRGSRALTMADLERACKGRSHKKISEFAVRLSPRYGWEDIILPRAVKEQLKEISGYVRNRSTVYMDWGFDEKLSTCKGLNVLFSGPSGTGKTMAVEVVAKDAGLDIFRVDASCIMSKYIGDTEKNIRRIFSEAESLNAILFFDEADALFGKRTEIKDSHDRYANIEVSYLLQKLDEHEGIVMLASNYKSNIDDAFTRRMHFIVDFPLPDVASSEAIWRVAFPADTPLEDIDYARLAKLKLTGGSIRNAALAAAFYAADDGRTVRMAHVMKAVQRELQKMGKLCGPDGI